MNSAEHKAEAERLVRWAGDSTYPLYSDSYRNVILQAQVHATLATIEDDNRVISTGPR